MHMIELYVTPTGLYDGSYRLPIDWPEAGNFLTGYKDDVKLYPFDSFNLAKCVELYLILQKAIDCSHGTIRWGHSPKES